MDARDAWRRLAAGAAGFGGESQLAPTTAAGGPGREEARASIEWAFAICIVVDPKMDPYLIKPGRGRRAGGGPEPDGPRVSGRSVARGRRYTDRT
ncbi:MAG: hypothetical protein DME09_06450 [Candidatus Rokuibacteriota bacterium]|nr:MAG: hypothetical protein DME09_06450 [Candidatus Rokubacteria bacterium]